MRYDTLPQIEADFRRDAASALTHIASNAEISTTRNLKNVLTTEDEIAAEFPMSKDALAAPETNEGYNPNDLEVSPPLGGKSAAGKKKVFALLVGINNYERVNKLHGCLNDVKVVRNYLENNPDFDAQIEQRTDAQATRRGVTDGFRIFLSQAGKDDTVLFYYSGHGTQENADPLWDETDGTLECMVCHDGGTTKPAEFLLTDKELRFLIYELSQKTKAHIVTIFDCCHSGDNTRNAALTNAIYKNEDRRERRVTSKSGGAFPQRKWDEFLFSSTIKASDLTNKKPAEFLPQGAHVQMAACESNQVALEIAGAGIFTKTLLKTLNDCGGNITYDALRSRVRQYMRVGFEQTPRVYMPIAAEMLLKTGFLNRTVEPDKMFCEATRNDQQGWQLNVGAIHGLDTRSKVTLYDPKNPDKTYAAQVRDQGVFVDFALLEVNPELNNETIYKAEVAGLMTKELILEMENHDGNPREMKAFAESLLEKTSGGFALGGEKKADTTTEKDSGKARQPDYALHVRSGEMYLTQPSDPFRPLIRPMSYFDTEGKQNASQIIEMLRHVSRWHFIKNLQNKDKPANFPAQPLKIELTRLLADGTSEAIDVDDETAKFEYEQIGSEWKGEVKIKITNTTTQDLYVCAAYLGTEFQCFLNFLPSRVELLPAHKSVLLGFDGNDRIGLQLDQVKREYNWLRWQETLKFIISTSEFVAEALGLEEFPSPLTTADRNVNRSTTKGGLVTSDKSVQFSGWLTQTLHLAFENPVYNRISGKTLGEMIDWDETAYFAAGLYYDVEMKDFGKEPILKLKKGLVVPEDEKGILQNIGMWLGNKIETAQRRKRYRNLRKDPNRTRIVAEGDSWFQYPIILQDTLDQLYKCYAIRSFAEAGDTLENYLKEREYVDSVREESARFFLVSGGGNDVLGDEFQYFLRETPDPDDLTPKRYLNQKLFDQLDKLDQYYEEMFTELLDSHADLHILVHCYDYLIPVDTNISANKKKSSWTGKHMVEKRIAPQEVREELIHYIVDEFANRLTALVAKAKYKDRVSFVDTRDLVPRDLWFDEIHPKNAGFELVANKFIEEIERIKAEKHLV